MVGDTSLEATLGANIARDDACCYLSDEGHAEAILPLVGDHGEIIIRLWCSNKDLATLGDALSDLAGKCYKNYAVAMLEAQAAELAEHAGAQDERCARAVGM